MNTNTVIDVTDLENVIDLTDLTDLTVDDFVCPISLCFFTHPVKASDNVIYEKKCIEEWLDHSNTSPMTGLPISNDLVQCELFETKLKKFYEKNPKLILEKYIVYDTKYLLEIISSNKFDQLSNYKLIDYQVIIDNNLCDKLFQCPDKILENIIDSFINLENFTKDWMSCIHFACKYSTLNIVKKLMSKGISYRGIDINKRKPIHYACQYSKLEIVNYFYSLGDNFESQDIDGRKPIHYACIHARSDLVKFMLDKVNLEPVDGLNQTPFVYALKRFNPIIIAMFIYYKAKKLYQQTIDFIFEDSD